MEVAALNDGVEEDPTGDRVLGAVVGHPLFLSCLIVDRGCRFRLLSSAVRIDTVEVAALDHEAVKVPVPNGVVRAASRLGLLGGVAEVAPLKQGPEERPPLTSFVVSDWLPATGAGASEAGAAGAAGGAPLGGASGSDR